MKDEKDELLELEIIIIQVNFENETIKDLRMQTKRNL